ncbi:hypothetical protein N0V87_001264 [Didymella glomerata]|uniref:Major facilitator superfamily (MFS) profile domain-containing protein n=1 Tax=Didymella glomerata TaxID=749621 RepID=A0A9W9C3X6_9PLEO|nr:hypothetical protein N0V87_001264 [Didymella glomerata]
MATGGDYLDKKVDSSALAETQGRSSGDFAATGESLNVDEKKLVRKLDLHLIPIVMLTYLLSFLDRVNIGNSRLYNMEKDLGLIGNQYQIAVSILFVTYITFEVPSNLVLKKFTPSRWIAFITFSWGIVATLTGLVQSYGGLIACRVLLGALEAGMFPGMSLYLTFWYTKNELALRVGYLFVSAAIAGALGGLLAFGIGRMDGLQGMSGWRWIMIIEGIPTVLLGIAIFFLLPNDPESAYFLNDNEKKMMMVRHGRAYGNTASAQEFDKQDVLKAFKDWKVWIFCASQFGADTMLYGTFLHTVTNYYGMADRSDSIGYSTFLPTIIKGLGTWTAEEVQLLTIPCYFVGALMCFLIAAGLYILVGLPLAWLPNNSPRYGKRAAANGLQLTIGNSSGIMAPFIYTTREGPRYIRGHAITLALVAMAVFIYLLMWTYFSKVNKQRAEGKVDREHEGLSEDELAELGDDSPHFRYVI